ncbi:MAG TPA: endonuclease/exonuclease/phosphatase, partial [Agriterribacter sp.]|nr:endonuclease/exonuclease/phosphatase [Agriterribacter sp.]
MKAITAVVLFHFLIIVAGHAQTVPAKGATRVKVMSYNVHHCNPPSKPALIDVDAIAKAIRQQNPDIVALQ